MARITAKGVVSREQSVKAFFLLTRNDKNDLLMPLYRGNPYA